MTNLVTLAIWFVLGACAVASFFDVRARTIPNWLTGSLAAAALVIHSFGGLRAVALSLAVMAILALLGMLLYSLGGIGGGDVKLAVAASGMLSFPLCLPFLIYTALGGGILAVAFVLIRGDIRQSLSRTVAMTASGPRSLAHGSTQSLPYAVAFAFGAVAVALAQSVAPFLRILS